ncbi:MAG: RHS repeat-associated core domain-containing protein [Candidatus Hydrogenedentes bacterium]|nr:RHS repeat-associated core domain-containing protein [Candidatus Hydrogenedentota bacterium]
MDIPNGMHTAYAYDTSGRLDAIHHKDGTTVVQGFDYTFDNGGNITRIDHEDGSYWAYDYDGRDRLIEAERYDDTPTLLHRYTYTYDDADNMLTKAVYDPSGPSTVTTTFTYNDANEQTSMSDGTTTTNMTYDEWGRLVEKDDGTYTATYVWGLGSELLQFDSNFPGQGTVSYQYGGDGKRRSVDDGTSFVWYNWARNIPINEEDQGAGVGDGPLSKTLIAFRAEVGGSDPSSGTYTYFATDHLGSIRSTFNQAKNNTGNAELAPFGTLYQAALPGATRARYSAHTLDNKTGLYYTEYRYYAPDNARWLNRDTFGAIDGPNLYAYVGNNPISYWDPNGASQVPTEAGG